MDKKNKELLKKWEMLKESRRKVAKADSLAPILFKEKDKELKFDILGYQYEDAEDDYDGNWLIVAIQYSDGEKNLNMKDCCLLSFEFKNLIEEIQKIIDGKETGFISDFMESGLSFAVTRVDQVYAFQVRFFCGNRDGQKEVYICRGFSLEKLKEINEGFRKLYEKFPYRKGKRK